MTDNNKVILISLSSDELKDIVRDVIRNEVNLKKEKEIMSAEECCEYLGISTSCLNAWKAKGMLPYRKIGKRNFYLKSEIDSVLEEAGNYKKLKGLK